MKARIAIALAALPLALSACATPRPAGPIEVTRFVDTDASAQLGNARLFVETAPGSGEQGLALTPYKNAVARELAAYGYVDDTRASARQTASVSVERSTLEDLDRRGPVSVGAGGSTGSYGSGVGLGLGINLGGGSDDRVVTRMEVRIRDSQSGRVLWEGRALLDAPEGSPLAQNQPAADALAEALFRGFPGNNGETIEVEVNP
ncbi:DUF4136 domain-containing protein [Citromicrobium bathyomarinum]|uniref:DUF4136 domain-containing protein n=1 Tax=Sphingomonadales TaxID=204457 RepID=UPI000C401FA1|nr:DUF4136 domain-containing protein [Citromicrobium sp.]MBO81332.1 hypothetical protein [Citromicrobium sp.]|tara:strand:+ start:49553 stop:50164 length:612 start_codon:yes stop_codon:yes gene_type:complete